jgi:HK97 family phage prohead protease
MRNIKTAPFTVKSVDEPAGIIERVVSVFGNVDYGGDAVQVGAFSDSIERWKASGDPIPVVFSHDWSNLDAHLGVVDDIKELPPGDPLLPDEIRDNGGLWVREKYDLHIPAAARAFELQQRRSLKESSFAYNTISERKTKNGVNELLVLDLIEVGPCLKGMNPATQLLAAKSVDPDAKIPDDLEEQASDHTPAIPNEDTGRVAVLPVDGPLDQPDDSGGQKAFVTLEGSYEKLIEDLTDALPDWTVLNFPAEDWWYVGVEATYPGYVVLYMETWADPPGRGNYQQAAYSSEDGALRIEAPTLVAIAGNVVPKAIRLAGEKLAGKANRGNPVGDSAEPVGGLTPASFLAVADMEVAALTAVSSEGETA